MNRNYISLALASILLTACGSSSSNKGDGRGSIDLADYFPAKSMTKTFSTVERDGDDVEKSHYDEIIEVVGNTITTTVEGEVWDKTTITDKNITTEDDGEIESMYRHVDLGDRFYSRKIEESEDTPLGKVTRSLTHVCTIKYKEDRFEKDDNVYTGDLLKVECLDKGTVNLDLKPSLSGYVSDDLNGSHDYYDTSYFYLKKGLGEVAAINDDCVINSKLPGEIIDDRKSGEACATEQNYEYEFYLP